MNDFLIALILLTGIVTAEARQFSWLDTAAKVFDQDLDDSLPPRLDHAAPGRGRAPAAICLMLERAGLPPDSDPEAPCN